MEKPIIIVERHWGDDKQTSGTCTVLIEEKPQFSSLALERGWQDNKRNISCIPTGKYELKFEYSPKFQRNLWEVKGVPERAECKFHPANYWYHLQGCIALGVRCRDMNQDGYLDVSLSTAAMDEFHYVLRNYTEATLIVKNAKSE